MPFINNYIPKINEDKLNKSKERIIQANKLPNCDSKELNLVLKKPQTCYLNNQDEVKQTLQLQKSISGSIIWDYSGILSRVNVGSNTEETKTVRNINVRNKQIDTFWNSHKIREAWNPVMLKSTMAKTTVDSNRKDESNTNLKPIDDENACTYLVGGRNKISIPKIKKLSISWVFKKLENKTALAGTISSKRPHKVYILNKNRQLTKRSNSTGPLTQTNAKVTIVTTKESPRTTASFFKELDCIGKTFNMSLGDLGEKYNADIGEIPKLQITKNQKQKLKKYSYNPHKTDVKKLIKAVKRAKCTRRKETSFVKQNVKLRRELNESKLITCLKNRNPKEFPKIVLSYQQKLLFSGLKPKLTANSSSSTPEKQVLISASENNKKVLSATVKELVSQYEEKLRNIGISPVTDFKTMNPKVDRNNLTNNKVNEEQYNIDIAELRKQYLLVQTANNVSGNNMNTPASHTCNPVKYHIPNKVSKTLEQLKCMSESKVLKSSNISPNIKTRCLEWNERLKLANISGRKDSELQHCIPKVHSNLSLYKTDFEGNVQNIIKKLENAYLTGR